MLAFHALGEMREKTQASRKAATITLPSQCGGVVGFEPVPAKNTPFFRPPDNLKKAGWSWGCVSALDSEGRTIWIVDAHRGDGKRFSMLALNRVLSATVSVDVLT
jgi:hypothetical protein